jgi:hypothetical protein
MPSMTEFKTHGAVMEALGHYLSQAMRDAHRHFGTPVYFQERGKIVHKAFDQFAADHGVEPAQTPRLRDMLLQHISRYPRWRTTAVDVLANELPATFNVRGAWTSPRLMLVAA